MKVSSRSILPVIEYIMNMFPEPFNSPSDKNYSTISLLLSQFISQQISYEECHKAISKITEDCRPLKKLKSILDVPPQPLPSDSETVLNFNFSSYTDSHTQLKQQPASLPVLSTTKKKFQNWSTAEDDRLICGIIRFGFDNWTTIANFVGNNRTRSQCNQRWARGLDPHISRDQWTTEESQKLISLVQIHGEKSWTHIASVMGNRSDIQCRYHFYQMTKRSRGYSFSNDSNNSPISKISNGPTRLSTPCINMPNYILPTNFPNNYTNTKSATDSLSNTGQTDGKNMFEPSDSFSRQRPLPSMLAPRMSAPILQNMPQIRSSSVTGINTSINISNINMNNGNSNMINSNNSINTLNNMNNNSNQMPKLNMINNMNSLTTINSNGVNSNNNSNNLQTSNNINNGTLNRNMNYQSFFPQIQQGPPMPQLNGFPRMNQFNPPPAPPPPPPQDLFFESRPSTNTDNTNNSNLMNNAFNSNKNTNNSNIEDNHFEEEDIDTVFQFTSKYSGIDDLIDDNGSWVVDRYKSYDVSREKYENEFIF